MLSYKKRRLPKYEFRIGFTDIGLENVTRTQLESCNVCFPTVAIYWVCASSFATSIMNQLCFMFLVWGIISDAFVIVGDKRKSSLDLLVTMVHRVKTFRSHYTARKPHTQKVSSKRPTCKNNSCSTNAKQMFDFPF